MIPDESQRCCVTVILKEKRWGASARDDPCGSVFRGRWGFKTQIHSKKISQNKFVCLFAHTALYIRSIKDFSSTEIDGPVTWRPQATVEFYRVVWPTNKGSVFHQLLWPAVKGMNVVGFFLIPMKCFANHLLALKSNAHSMDIRFLDHPDVIDDIVLKEKV